MKVPLQVRRVPQNGEEFLEIWSNKTRSIVKAPIKPYFYSKIPDIKAAIEIEKVNKISLSTLKSEEWYKYIFPLNDNIRDINNIYSSENILKDQNEETDSDEESKNILIENTNRLLFANNKIPFIDNIAILRQNFYSSFPNEQELTILFLDIEQLTDGKHFPRQDALICSMAWSFNDEKVKVVAALNEDEERSMLQTFINDFKRHDPDIIVGYNILRYDLPRIDNHVKRFGLSIPFSRSGGYFIEEGKAALVGRLVFDIYLSVAADQQIRGTKNKRLKTIAEYKGIEVKKIDTTNTKAYLDAGLDGIKTLMEYNASDVEITKKLFNIYFGQLVSVAEELGVPLSRVISNDANGNEKNLKGSFTTLIIYGRICEELGIISDGTNLERNPELILRDSTGHIVKYQGAAVGLNKMGLHKPTFKIDFASMYPHIMIATGCGPENTKVVKMTEYSGNFFVKREKEATYYNIPDSNHNKDILIEVRGESKSSAFLERLLKDRLELKKKEQSASGAEKEYYKTKQGVSKVILNSIYGTMGSHFFRFGNIAIAILTAGIGRELIRYCEEIVGDTRIETDTDGLYLNAKPDLQYIIGKLNTFATLKCGCRPIFNLELDEYEAGWFHAMKNYILLKKTKRGDLKIERYGAAFQGSHTPGVFDKTIESLALAVFTKSREDARRIALNALHLDSYNFPHDFVQRIKLGREINDYKNGKAISYRLALRAQEIMQIEPKKGTQYDYIKSKDDYILAVEADFKNIDTKYYMEIINEAIIRLGFENVKQRKLIEF